MSDCLGNQGAQETTSNVEATQGAAAQPGEAHFGCRITIIPSVSAIIEVHNMASCNKRRKPSFGDDGCGWPPPKSFGFSGNLIQPAPW
eukprot:CAMPEP_0180759092 /NCGR_PEP_ID=MMETSP1038_2-20121128/35617_1 /TAXON_ID=632150 /ORGANISM="Azadinium spinosum, Strain 3D9" /LENGTH=87 /DNA_ID=CAMNT_0022793193 /DNA_START=76 /DNA_END=339 /DNA_ORIENTATION=-